MSNIKTNTIKAHAFPIAKQTHTSVSFRARQLVNWYRCFGKDNSLIVEPKWKWGYGAENLFFLSSIEELDNFLAQDLDSGPWPKAASLSQPLKSNMIALLNRVQSQSTTCHQNKNAASQCNLSLRGGAGVGSTGNPSKIPRQRQRRDIDVERRGDFSGSFARGGLNAPLSPRSSEYSSLSWQRTNRCLFTRCLNTLSKQGRSKR